MGVTTQLRRLLVPGPEANGNAFIALTAVTGAVGWGVTAAAVHLLVPFPAGGALAGEALADWTEGALVPTMTLVMGVWVAVWGGRLALGYLRVERGAVVNGPNLVWFVGSGVALALNAYGVTTGNPELVWLPWLVVFAVAYLATAVLVERPGVYWLAGGVSAVLSAYGVYAVLTDTGYAVLGPVSELPASAAGMGAGTVLMPVPFTYVILGALHVVPMAVDAARGGRHLTDTGLPAVRDDDVRDDTGVVPSD